MVRDERSPSQRQTLGGANLFLEPIRAIVAAPRTIWGILLNRPPRLQFTPRRT